MHGYVLTNGRNTDYLYDFLRRDNVDILKIIPAWYGLPDESIPKILSATKDTIIRTSYGDPSRNIIDGVVRDRAKDGRDYRYLIPESLSELDRFLRIKPHCFIELGNEPNLHNVDYWIYRYYLQQSFNILKQRYPYAKFISTAPIVAGDHHYEAVKFYETTKDVLQNFDYSGIHAYAHESFDDDFQLGRALELANKYTRKPINKPMLTEYGINSNKIPMKEKLQRYKDVRNKYKDRIAAFCIFHIADKDSFSNYSVTRDDL